MMNILTKDGLKVIAGAFIVGFTAGVIAGLIGLAMAADIMAGRGL